MANPVLEKESAKYPKEAKKTARDPRGRRGRKKSIFIGSRSANLKKKTVKRNADVIQKALALVDRQKAKMAVAKSTMKRVDNTMSKYQPSTIEVAAHKTTLISGILLDGFATTKKFCVTPLDLKYVNKFEKATPIELNKELQRLQNNA